MMTSRLAGMIGILFACGSALAHDSPPLPEQVPPVLGMAMVEEPGTPRADEEWKIRLTLPKVAWEVIGKFVSKEEWPELKAEVEKATLTLKMGGPSALAPSRIVDLTGRELDHGQVIERLEQETPVLVSLSGQMPDDYYLQLTKPESLVVILGPRDGYPAVELLPVKKEHPAQPDNRSNQ
jgi:hypothetical protein